MNIEMIRAAAAARIEGPRAAHPVLQFAVP